MSDGSIDPALLEAYRRTTYRAELPGGPVEIRVGRACPQLDGRLAELGASCWAFVSAANPRSAPLSEAENASRHDRLRRAVAATPYRSFEGAGIPADDDWHPEPSLLIVGIEPDAARELAARFDQLAIVVGLEGGPAVLVTCPGR